jgi:hypothetical protein
MVIVTTTTVRPNANVPFYLQSNPSLREQFNKFMNGHPKVKSRSSVLSEDTLTFKTVIVCDSQEDLEAIRNDVNAAFPNFYQNRKDYCDAHNIKIDVTVE